MFCASFLLDAICFDPDFDFVEASLLNYAKLRNVYLDEFDHAVPSEKSYFFSCSSWG